MKFFQASHPGVEIFVSVGTGCPTGCQNCYKTLQKNSSLTLEQIKFQIDVTDASSDSDFSYFIYGTDILQHPDIDTIVNYIGELKRQVKIQIPLTTPVASIMPLVQKNRVNIFVISQKISSQSEIIQIVRSIQEFFKKPDISINYDLLISDTHKALLSRIINTTFSRQTDGTHTAQIKNISINLRSLYHINTKEKIIENLAMSSCMVYDSFDITEDHITIHDHFEVEPNGDITFHNPLCYIGQPKISNITKPHGEMITDFTTYKTTFLKPLNHNLEKNCFTCITKGYSYNR